jgi:hypothetical protein
MSKAEEYTNQLDDQDEPSNVQNGAVAVAEQPPVEYVETSDETALRSLIFQTSDIVERMIDIPEWKINGKVVQILLRALSAGERAEYITMMQKSNGDLSKAYPDLVIMSARHPGTKNKIFKPADRGELQKKLGNAIERIAMNVVDISGLDEKSLQSYIKK